jgi:hypothetical protein
MSLSIAKLKLKVLSDALHCYISPPCCAAGGGRGGQCRRLPRPLPNSYRTVLTRHAGLSERVTYTALHALSQYAAEDQQLQELVASYDAYSDWAGVVVSA